MIALTASRKYSPNDIVKFNPFHDSRGRFANKYGFKTYSANPKMRAAQPSIMRSARAGHGRTLNVHRESKGENIAQNYDWMRGRPTGTPAAQRTANRSNSSTPAPKPAQKPTQRPQQPNNVPKQSVSDASIAAGKAANAVNGKDLSGKFKFDDNSMDYSIEQVIKAQGFDGKPTLTSNLTDFTAACKASNFIAKRGIGASDQATMDAYDKALKTGDFYVKCTGGSVHGYGMYAASIQADGKNANSSLSHAERTARSYTSSGVAKKVYTMTLDKSAKIGNEYTLRRQMRKDTEFQQVCSASKMRSKHTNDVGVYAAYKGYDAYIAGDGSGRSSSYYSDYTVILNRSKVILYDGA